MNKRTVILALSLASLCCSLVAAAPFDGITLSAVPGPAPGTIALEWTGGQPDFTIYRSGSADQVAAPGHEIGLSPIRAFTDAAPTGPIAYYLITSPCVYAPPEICDGVDNDCNGTIDGPGSEASCSLAHATPVCAAGACAIGACNSGFGDCNGGAADGCETDTHVAQSTSPEGLWAGDPDPDQDLMPGYLRVPAITNCGACGSVDPSASCNNGSACTTDLCVPVGSSGAQSGVCRHYDRAQCAEARCSTASLPQGTPLPRDPACTGIDSDGDGLPNAWETAQTSPYSGLGNPVGIDLDCDGEISDTGGDMIWHEPPAGPAAKDIYLEYDVMEHPPDPCTGPADCLFGEACLGSMCTGHTDAPLPESITEVAEAFAAEGAALHVDPNHQALAHSAVVYFPVQGPDSCASPGNTSFYDIKQSNFDERRSFGYHYFIFGHQSCAEGNAATLDASGIAEVQGNDAIVTLAPFDFTYTGSASQIATKRLRQESGATMHELGHNLGLHHGGATDPNASDPNSSTADTNQKPNHVSSMNYSYQFVGIQRATGPGTIAPLDPNIPRRVDYSHGVLDALDEGALDESEGMGISPPPFDRDIVRYFCPGSGGPVMAPGQGPVDWNCDGVMSAPVSDDLNDSATFEALEDSDEWASLDFTFQCQPTLADGAQPPPGVARDELTVGQAVSRRLLADATAYCDPGFDDCDGNPTNGCETPILDDTDNCGGCGQSCSASHLNPSCYLGTCNGTCDPGFADCNGDKRGDGCEIDLPTDLANCGACGRSCAGVGDSCQGGECRCGPGGACDALFCTLGAMCAGGSCSGGAPRDCSTGEACSTGSCDEATNQCEATCTTLPCWTTPVGGGTGSAPAHDSSFNPSEGHSYVAKGTKLYAFRNGTGSGGPAGSIKWEWDAPSTLDNFPNPVILSTAPSGPVYIFVTAADGYLYKIDGSDGSPSASVNTRRPSCATDKLLATPAVQLYMVSDSSFKSEVDSHPGHQGDDVVVVVTRNGCGDLTRNTIKAYWASNLSAKWTFNATGSKLIDFGSDGCALDYGTNTLYCGTDLPAGRNQNTLWAIDTTTGGLRWSYNAGAIRNRPILKTGPSGLRLYVANAAGTLQAYAPQGDGAGSGLPLWTQPVALPGPVIQNLWTEKQPGPTSHPIVVVDETGQVSGIADAGARGVLAWRASPPAGGRYISMPAVMGPKGKVFVGRDDGMVEQLDASTGQSEAVVIVAGPGDPAVYDPSLDPDSSSGGDRLTVASGITAAGSMVSRFCVPWGSASGACTSPADCAGWNGPCAQGLCDLASGACYSEPLPGGLPCADPTSTCSDGNSVCVSGACVASGYSACPCESPGDRACPTGMTCCGSTTGCTDLNADPGNCGGCGNACGPGMACTSGVCKRSTANCPAGITLADTLFNVGNFMSGADSIAYERTPLGVCSAYVATYATTGPSSLKKVDPFGGVTQATLLSPDQAPLHGVDVVREGDLVFATMVNRPPGQFPLATPGMATGSVSSGSLGAATTAQPTSSTIPFSDPRFDTGPVGPALDYLIDPNNPGARRVYLGNWVANGDLYLIGRSCPICPWIATPVSHFSNPTGSRITAIAFEEVKVPGPVTVKHRHLFVGHGSTLSILDLDADQQTDVDLSQPPPGASRIFSLTVDPWYGDVYMEVDAVGSPGTNRLLMVREDDHSIRNLYDAHVDLRVVPPAPQSFPDQGRICASSGAILERLVPNAFPGSQPAFMDILLVP